jgi:hypothetical protein
VAVTSVFQVRLAVDVRYIPVQGCQIGKSAIMARRTGTHRWFVSVEAPREPRLGSRASVRQTKTFPTEAEAKQYAKEMLLSEQKNVVAGTLLSAHQPTRRIISGSELYRWIEEAKS